MARKLRQVETITQLGGWLERQGFTVTEGPGRFGPIHNVHSTTSLHYKGLAFDVNHPASGAVETRKLRALYDRLLDYRRHHPHWPLDEMFFAGHGFRKETGVDTNAAISGHDTHLHVAFERARWEPGGKKHR